MTDYRRGPGKVQPTLWTQDRVAEFIAQARQSIQQAKDRAADEGR